MARIMVRQTRRRSRRRRGSGRGRGREQGNVGCCLACGGCAQATKAEDWCHENLHGYWAYYCSILSFCVVQVLVLYHLLYLPYCRLGSKSLLAPHFQAQASLYPLSILLCFCIYFCFSPSMSFRHPSNTYDCTWWIMVPSVHTFIPGTTCIIIDRGVLFHRITTKQSLTSTYLSFESLADFGSWPWFY